MITKTLWAGASAIAAIAAGTVAVESRYEKHTEAQAEYQQLAADQESDRLRTQLEIVQIKIAKFLEIAKVHPLTESEQIELRSFEQERAALLTRLASKS